MTAFKDLADMPEPEEPYNLAGASMAEMARRVGQGTSIWAAPPPPEHDRRTADATQNIDQKMADLVDAMRQTIEINQQAQAAATRTEKFTRTMAWSSLGVSIISLGVAVLALLV